MAEEEKKQLNRLIIIGNGFDLAHELPTSFSDFMVWYIKKCYKDSGYIPNYNDVVFSFKAINYPEVRNPPNFLEKFNNENEFKEIVALFKSCEIEVTGKSSFTQALIKQLSDKNWVDIELEYYKNLTSNISDDEQVISEISVFNQQIDFLKTKLNEYFSEVVKEKVDAISYKFAHHFTTIFSRGLEHNIEKSKIQNIYILNFNYTDTVSNYIKEYRNDFERQRIKEIKIHGSFEDINSMIFGFGDEIDKNYKVIEDLNHNEYFKHVKSFKYLQNNNYQKLMNFVKGTAKDSLEVYVMGHSLGLSDRTMLSQIFESESLHKVKIFYHQWGKEEHENDYTERLYEISRHFSDKGRMRTKIVPFDKCEALPQLKNTNL